MNLYCNKCSKFANDNDIEMKLETDGKKVILMFIALIVVLKNY